MEFDTEDQVLLVADQLYKHSRVYVCLFVCLSQIFKNVCFRSLGDIVRPHSVFSFVGIHCTSPLCVFVRWVTLYVPTLCFRSLGYIVRPHSVFSFVGLHCTSPLFAPWVHSVVGRRLLMEDDL